MVLKFAQDINDPSMNCKMNKLKRQRLPGQCGEASGLATTAMASLRESNLLGLGAILTHDLDRDIPVLRLAGDIGLKVDRRFGYLSMGRSRLL